MSVTPKNTYRCDFCLRVKTVDHGGYAEAAEPKGWTSAMDYPVHACSKRCEEEIQTRKATTSDPRPWIFAKPTVEAA